MTVSLHRDGMLGFDAYGARLFAPVAVVHKLLEGALIPGCGVSSADEVRLYWRRRAEAAEKTLDEAKAAHDNLQAELTREREQTHIARKQCAKAQRERDATWGALRLAIATHAAEQAEPCAGCFHLADSDEPADNLNPTPCARCGLYYVNDGDVRQAASAAHVPLVTNLVAESGRCAFYDELICFCDTVDGCPHDPAKQAPYPVPSPAELAESLGMDPSLWPSEPAEACTCGGTYHPRGDGMVCDKCGRYYRTAGQ